MSEPITITPEQSAFLRRVWEAAEKLPKPNVDSPDQVIDGFRFRVTEPCWGHRTKDSKFIEWELMGASDYATGICFYLTLID